MFIQCNLNHISLSKRRGIFELLNHIKFILQFTVQASDQRIPERTATSEVRINILRDRFSPIFIQEPYGTSVSENTVNGTSIYRVTATDQDLRVGGEMSEVCEITILNDN